MIIRLLVATLVGSTAFVLRAHAQDTQFRTGLIAKGDGAQFAQYTTPQIARLGNGQLLAIMSVRAKNDQPQRRIAGAFSKDGGLTWEIRILQTETDPKYTTADANMLVDGSQVFIYWTRVEKPNNIKKSWTWVIHSSDHGTTWSEPREVHIPRQYTAGKQHNAIKLADGSYAMGISWDRWPERGYSAKTEGETNISSGILLSRDGFNWNLFGDLHVYIEKTTPHSVNGLAEPALVQLADGELYLLLRSGGSRHYEARSRDGGVTWSNPQMSPLVGHNSPSALWRVDNAANEIIAVWNQSPVARIPLVASLSSDGGRTWSPPRIVATARRLGVSYPGVTQAADGAFVVVWQAHPEEGGRDVAYARFTREWLLQTPTP